MIEFTRSTLPSPESYQDTEVLVIESDGKRTRLFSDGLAWRTTLTVSGSTDPQLTAAQMAATQALVSGGGNPLYVTGRPPTPADDTAAGYKVGDTWAYGGAQWIARRVTAGAALWQPSQALVAPLGDMVPTGLLGIYGMQKLVNAYAGQCMQLTATISAATVTQDIGFVAVTLVDGTTSYLCDYAAADAFAARCDSGTVCNVTKLYDQSGNTRDLVQATRANAPMWVRSGQAGRMRGPVMQTGVGQNISSGLDFATTGMTHDWRSVSVAMISRAPISNNGIRFALKGTARSAYWAGQVNASSSPGYGSTMYASGAGFVPLFAAGHIGVPRLDLFTSGASNYTFSVNDNDYTSGTAAFASTTFDLGWHIGGTTALPTYSDQEIFAFAVWSGQLSAAQRAAVKAWAYSPAWGIQPQIRDTVTWQGDSRLAGTGTTNLQHVTAVAMGQVKRPYLGYCFALSGYTGANVATYAANFVPNFMPAAARHVLVPAYGINDATGGLTGAQIYTQMATNVATGRTAGINKVVGRTILPYGSSTAGAETARLDANAAIKAAGWDAVSDLAADPDIGAKAQTSNTTYYRGDGLHLVDLGSAVQAGIDAAAINSLL